jgi:DNA processing protein
MYSHEQLCQIALTRIPQVGAITARNLVAWCGGAEAVFKTKKKDLLRIPGIGLGIAAELESPEPLRAAERELEFVVKNDIEILFFTDKNFPERLTARRDSPIVLYFKGSNLALLNHKRMVAVVGTRDISEHGRAICEELVEGLLPYDIVLVSGLAFGVDVTAHRKATAIGMPNVGVLGHGLGTVYPAQNRPIAQRMIEHGGLLTEYMHDIGPDREHFPMRNRIITGLCDVLLVVETANSGGSMISVEFAEKHNLDIFAVPGRPKDPKSAGCNALIKGNRAKLVESAQDITDALNWSLDGNKKPVQTQLFVDLDPLEDRLLGHVRTQPMIAIDDLSAAMELPTGELATHILQLEFKGLLKTHPGKRYTIV